MAAYPPPQPPDELFTLPPQLALIGGMLWSVVVLITAGLTFLSARTVEAFTAFALQLIVVVVGVFIFLRTIGNIFRWQRKHEIVRSNLLQAAEQVIQNAVRVTSGQHAPFPLALVSDPSAVSAPYIKIEAKESDQILQVYQEANCKLLILGRHGGGKSTLLTHLARQLLEQARQKPQAPIPLLIQLASWRSTYGTLEKWLEVVLFREYGVREVNSNWLPFVLLLDGLDEVPALHRNSCAKAINQFRQHYPYQLVVACEQSIYQQLEEKLDLSVALVIQDLTPQQIRKCLAGDSLRGVLNLYEAGKLADLTLTPGSLSLLIKAYANRADSELELPPDQDRRTHLVQAYMANHPPPIGNHGFDHQSVTRYLAWLAAQMTRLDQPVFYLDQLQPAWLDTPTLRSQYRWSNLLLGLLLAPLILLAGFGGMMIFLVVWIIVETRRDQNVHLANWRRWSWWTVRGQLAMLAAVCVGIVGALVTGGNIALGVIIGLAFLLGSLVVLGLTDTTLTAVEELKKRSHPNQGIWDSLQTGVLNALLFVASLMSIIVLFNFQLLTPDYILIGMTVIGAFLTGLLLSPGGIAFRRHFTIRSLLWQKRTMPAFWQYTQFLNFAHSIELLRKLNGGYHFSDPLLQEHFAKLYKSLG